MDKKIRMSNGNVTQYTRFKHHDSKNKINIKDFRSKHPNHIVLCTQSCECLLLASLHHLDGDEEENEAGWKGKVELDLFLAPISRVFFSLH